MIELISIEPSKKKNKRFDAYIKQNNKNYKISFGNKNIQSYALHKDYKRKIMYMKKHLRFLQKTFTKIEPQILNICILWSYPNLEKSIKEFKKQLKNLNKGISFKTDIELYEKIKKKLEKGNKRKIWWARMSQQLSREYKKQFIKLYNKPFAYINFKNEKRNQLKKWTKEDWQYLYKDSKRYLPKKIINKLTKEQKIILSKNKRLNERSKWPKFLVELMKNENMY